MMALIFFVITAVLFVGRREFAEVLALVLGRLK
jgi:hypothetical protein